MRYFKEPVSINAKLEIITVQCPKCFQFTMKEITIYNQKGRVIGSKCVCLTCEPEAYKTTTVTLNDELIKSIGINDIVSLNQGWSNYDTISVISPSEKPMASEWIDQAHAKAMDFVCKKRSYEQLKEKGFVGLLDKWYAKSVKK